MARAALPAALIAAGLALGVSPAQAADPVGAAIQGQTLVVKGTERDDKIALRVRAAAPKVLEVDVKDDGSADFAFKREHVKRILVDARAGDDRVRIDDSQVQFNLDTPTVIDGGQGHDDLRGGAGRERFVGGAGNDEIEGKRGDDLALMGHGDDLFEWDPGDGSDRVEGQAGRDELGFDGAGVPENFTVSANGHRVKFFRDVANITMDLDDVEKITTNALGGPDTMTVENLSGTDAKEIVTDLAPVLGGAGGDGQVDRVLLKGTHASDSVSVTGNAAETTVSGLPARVRIKNSEPTDTLAIKTLRANDSIDASALAAGSMALTLDGGDHDDRLLGGRDKDAMLGGSGRDFADGNQGDDTGLMGAHDDVFQWDPGDGSDKVEGQAGRDELRFNGAGAAEKFDVSRNGSRVKFFRDVANITMDLDDVERITTNALGGPDTLTVNDLTGTDAKQIVGNLAGAIGGAAGDGAADSVVVNGTEGHDRIRVAGSNGNVSVSGLAADVRITGAEAHKDQLTIAALGGKDKIDASQLAAHTIGLLLDGGDADDLFIGSPGKDQIEGARGDDLGIMGAGDDTFAWDPGDGNDTVEGQAGRDELAFLGANVPETVDITANGNRVRFFRNVAAVLMDLDDTEQISFAALGGEDRVNVGDLSGTDAKDVDVDLAGVLGTPGGDGAADDVVVQGTNAPDHIRVAGSNGTVDVTGLPADVGIRNAEAAKDELTLFGRGGLDVFDTGGLAPNTIGLHANQ
jgi:Ca2+-binding RTX toxin-like protein